MYKGYKIEIDSSFFEVADGIVLSRKTGKIIDRLERNFNLGLKEFTNTRDYVRGNLEEFIRHDGYVDAQFMEAEWFPTVNAHVFLSHSHADEELAIAFAHWLNYNFGITTFIDSTVWGYALDLQQQLDDRYNLRWDTNTYDYSGSNRVCGFVDMLLATALSKMIDKCECFMFLETSNSLIETRNANRETSSPWIYHELIQSKIIEKRQPRPSMKVFSRGGVLQKAVIDSLNENFKVALPASMEHLIELSASNIIAWREIRDDYDVMKNASQSLDLLYILTNGLSNEC